MTERLTGVGRAALASAAHRSAEARRRKELADVHPDAEEPEDGENHQDGNPDPEPVGSVHDRSMDEPVNPS